MNQDKLLARGFWESWRGIMIVNLVVRRCWCNAFFLSPHDFSERLKIWNFGNNKQVAPWCVEVQESKKKRKKSHCFGLWRHFSRKCSYSLSPHDFSKRLKIWNFGKNKKVSSRWVDVQQQRKFWKKSFFWLTNNRPLSVKALLHRGLLLAQR